LFKHKTGLELSYIPYKGSAQSITDMIGGETHMTIDGLITLMPLIRDGKLRPLAMARAERWPDLPDVPTMGEYGLTDFTVDAWTAVVAPAGTPKEIVAKLNTVINEGLKSPETKTALARLNAIAKIGTPEDFSTFLAGEVPKWAALVKLAGAKAE
jgi:tripartite-type tricarboxylate transporter receptor subunit TctC